MEFISGSDLIKSVEVLREAVKITLWVGTTVVEQLLLAWLVQFLRKVDIDPCRLHVIQFDHKALNWRNCVTVGVLDVDRIREHPPAWSDTRWSTRWTARIRPIVPTFSPGYDGSPIQDSNIRSSSSQAPASNFTIQE